MKFQFYFGPDKLPFKLTESGMVEENSTMPFHGIISRGLLNEFIKRSLNVELWHRNAHKIHEDSIGMSNDLSELLYLKNECKVLSFGQSALAARKYLEEQCKIGAMNNSSTIDIWNIKEGHTSSVWKILVIGNTNDTYILNVARDYEASKELKETSEKLQTIGRLVSDAEIAKVLEITTIKDNLLPFEVIVTRNQWIHNSFEIHCRKSRVTDTDELILVDKFLTESNNPASITSVLGRRFSEIETKKIYGHINHFLTKAATCLKVKPSLNINDGDLVWDGEKAIVVAIN